MRNSFLCTVLVGLLAMVAAASTAHSFEDNEERHTLIEKVSVEDARSKVLDGKAYLVCAYNDKRCQGLLLEGALTRREFEQKLPDLPKDQEIIIYCS